MWESQDDPKNLFDLLSTAFLLIDRNQNCAGMNAAAETLTGYSSRELQGRSLREILLPGRLGNVSASHDKSLLEHPHLIDHELKGEAVFRHKNGTPLPVTFRACPFQDRSQIVSGTLLEVHALDFNEPQATLRKRSERLQALASASLAITAAASLEELLTSVTKAAQEIVGVHQATVGFLRNNSWSSLIAVNLMSDKYKEWKDFKASPHGSGIYTMIGEANKPIRMTQAELEAHPRWRGFGQYASAHPPMRGWLAAPLVWKDDRILGLIQLSDKTDGSEFDAEDEAVIVQLSQLASVAIERVQAEEQQRLLINELNHRVKNTLATVQSIAAHTLRNTHIPRTVHEAFLGRLISLAQSHNVLTRENWEGAELTSVIEEAIKAYRGGSPERLHVRGPKVRVSPRMVLSLSMALYELATNAAKYGALSNDSGEVEIVWVLRSPSPDGEERQLLLSWRERGGPPVKPPTHKGFGSRLIERGLGAELGGKAQISYDPTGVSCEVILPIE
ncbi:HWE histidine kinase domain-containing protein [Microvirga sp. 2MCAF35]|uniref:HWE histidine kinase domain-containing protein n=1 Tax=Microvirga sp. 2MCAF35 TaxID=3232987 RepID=UPI003F961964